MGRMYYGNSDEAIEIDDVDLAHLRMVAMTKLRRSEGFSLTLASPQRGRTALWVHCAIPLRFEFESANPSVSIPRASTNSHRRRPRRRAS